MFVGKLSEELCLFRKDKNRKQEKEKICSLYRKKIFLSLQYSLLFVSGEDQSLFQKRWNNSVMGTILDCGFIWCSSSLYVITLYY